MGVRLRTASGYADLYVLFRGGVAVAATEGAGLDAGWYEASDMDIAAAELPAGVHDGAFLHGDWENPSADDAEEGVFADFTWDGAAQAPAQVALADGSITSASFAAGAIDNAAVSFDLDLAFDDADIKQFFVTGLSEQTSAFVESGSLGKRLVDNVDATISSRLAPSVAGRTLAVSAAGNAAADVALWRGTQPNTLSSGRVETLVGAMNSGVITSSVIASGALTSHTIGVSSLTQAALAQFATTDTGQGSGVSGSVVNLSQGSADPVAIRQEIDNNSTKLAAILEDTGTTLPAALEDLEATVDFTPVLDELAAIKGATFDTATDSLEAIRNRGDSEWTGDSAAETAAAVRTELATELGRITTALPNAAPGSGSGLPTSQQIEELEIESSGILTDVDEEPVPIQRQFVFVPSPQLGLLDRQSKSLRSGTSDTFAFDFRNDLPANGRVLQVTDVVQTSGPSGGITFGDKGRDGTKAKCRITAVAAGTYGIRVRVLKDSGATAEGTCTLIVP